jgi:succinate dehydrogenase / fumarate reductase, cytochrome b subunit
MADVNRGNRPLSPHISVYGWKVTMLTSILTRITGNALLISGLIFVWWLLAAATSDDAFAIADGLMTSWFGKLVLIFSTLGLWYHLLAGLRHLLWDTAHGLDLKTAELLSWVCLFGSVVLTILTVGFIWGMAS